ncbi:MAG: transporter substrate-binding domain-containing protein [Methylococcales bacterium]|nr:transporter substrate-binding domain-containing protein [Methylococcales bacterium]
MKKIIIGFLVGLLITTPLQAEEKPTIRLGVLAFGTVNWELTALKNEIKTPSFNLDIRRLTSPQAGKIALQSGAVDMIVADWVWVSRQRENNFNFSFYPYSTASGRLMVSPKSAIHSVNDLIGKKLGIAGGALDKNWLLLQTLSQRSGLTLKEHLEPVFGAPPLLSHQLEQGHLDAVMTYWHYGAKLEAKGFRSLLSGSDIISGLGIEQKIPMLGYVFQQDFANQHTKVLPHFFNNLDLAKAQLCLNDASWQKIVPLTKANDQKTAKLLRQRYCEGRIKQWGPAEHDDAEKIYTLLKELSNNRLTGQSEHINPGTFWMPSAP